MERLEVAIEKQNYGCRHVETSVISLTPEEEEGARNALKTLRMAITPYYATLMDKDNPKCPIRRQAVPTAKELYTSPWDMLDPLHEDEDSPVPGLTHRYPDRVLILVTDMCSMYCRHCTRRRFAGQHDRSRSKQEIDAMIEYIRETPQVRDVLLSGGDAMLVGVEMLAHIKELRKIKHVEIIRIGTRTPVVLPQGSYSRIDKHAKKVSSSLDKYTFQPSKRDNTRIDTCMRDVGRCGNSTWKSISLAQSG